VLGGAVPTLADLPKLVYTKAVLKEAMRLYPPIWILERRCIREDEFAGYRIPAGSSVVISPYALHRHPDFWREPEVFDPSRFLEEGNLPAYLPFGHGPRYCIGHEFAMMEGQIIIAMVIQAFSLRPISGPPVVALPGITLRTKHGVRVSLVAQDS
jgi:cytochrome P450